MKLKEEARDHEGCGASEKNITNEKLRSPFLK
jgi:hypothetical protein